MAVKNSQGMTIQNDNLSSDEFGQFIAAAVKAASEVMKKGAPFYIWFASKEYRAFWNAIEGAGLTIKQELIWNKNSFVLGRQDYQWKHEPCLYGWKDGAAHYFCNSRSEATVIPDVKEIDFKKMKKDEAIQLLKEIYAQHIPTSVIDCDKPTEDTDHPTMKPVKLIAYQMANSSKKGDVVLDPFGGSGTTIIAAEQIGRKAYCMEIDPHYCDVIIARWEKMTGKEAVKLN
ncbi:MAG: hypothetical protein MJY71_02520 [Bacteroidaceae bacterium]|nr:hypothetical protein [Bacteroidaceae bacterium]